MRRILPPAHATFSAANRTITFATTVPASLSHILRVVNLTTANVLFDPTAESGLGYLSSATYASPVLTLGVSTAGMSNSDSLFIEYDDGQGGGGGGGGGGGDASAANQALQLTQLEAINADLGAPDAAPATNPTATAGIGPLLRLGLQGLATALTNWATLLERIPALSSGRVPVTTTAQQGGGTVTATTTRVTLATDGPGVANLASIAGLSIPAHDYVALGYTGSNLTTVTYRSGGVSGTVVGTLTLAYSGSTLTSVTRS